MAAKQDPQHKGASHKRNAKISVTPRTGSREIPCLTTHETKVKFEMEMEAQQNPEQFIGNGSKLSPAPAFLTGPSQTKRAAEFFSSPFPFS